MFFSHQLIFIVKGGVVMIKDKGFIYIYIHNCCLS